MRKQCRPPLETKDLDNCISKFNFKHILSRNSNGLGDTVGNVYVNPLQNANNIIYQGDKLV